MCNRQSGTHTPLILCGNLATVSANPRTRARPHPGNKIGTGARKARGASRRHECFQLRNCHWTVRPHRACRPTRRCLGSAPRFSA
eukprot:3706374-Prymnesium_polylepis.1